MTLWQTAAGISLGHFYKLCHSSLFQKLITNVITHLVLVLYYKTIFYIKKGALHNNLHVAMAAYISLEMSLPT